MIILGLWGVAISTKYEVTKYAKYLRPGMIRSKRSISCLCAMVVWQRSESVTPDEWRFRRYREAYLAMAKRTKYRPGAPSDGFGDILLLSEEMRNPLRLEREACEYA